MSRSHPNHAAQKRQRRARLIHSIYIWHRWLGLSVLLWVLLFAISGLLIEAAPTLGLDKRHIENPLLLKRYGISAPQLQSQWPANHHSVTVWDQGVYYQDRWLDSKQPISAVIANDEWLLIASKTQLSLYSLSGELIDQLPLPADELQQLGLTADGRVAVNTPQGQFIADASLLTWHSAPPSTISWAKPSAVSTAKTPPPLHDISWERVLLDVHSGALFGPVGRWLSRLAAVIMILLAASGFYTWFSRFAKRPR